jgi:DNA-directed RNA polymerase subunit RPC12/RpoP
MQQQEMIKEKELEFILCPNHKYKCSDCEKSFSHIEHCKDGKSRCKLCKRKIVTNKFYNPNWKIQNQYVGKYNISSQEKDILITNKVHKGMSLDKAKREVSLDISQLQKTRNKKFYDEKEQEKYIQEKKELNENLLKGLGLKK